MKDALYLFITVKLLSVHIWWQGSEIHYFWPEILSICSRVIFYGHKLWHLSDLKIRRSIFIYFFHFLMHIHNCCLAECHNTGLKLTVEFLYLLEQIGWNSEIWKTNTFHFKTRKEQNRVFSGLFITLLFVSVFTTYIQVFLTISIIKIFKFKPNIISVFWCPLPLFMNWSLLSVVWVFV